MAPTTESLAEPDKNIATSLEKDVDVEAGRSDSQSRARDTPENDGTTRHVATAQKPAKSAAEEDDEGKVYPPASSVMVVMVGLYLSLFLVSLVHTPSFQPPAYSLLGRDG